MFSHADASALWQALRHIKLQQLHQGNGACGSNTAAVHCDCMTMSAMTSCKQQPLGPGAFPCGLHMFWMAIAHLDLVELEINNLAFH